MKYSQIGLVIFLGIIFLIENAALAFCTTLKYQQSPILPLLFSISVSSTLALWVHSDSKLTGASMGLDQAMYIFFAWPITFPIYIYKTRGFLAGSLILFVLISTYIITLIGAIIVAVIIIQ
jgi:hypothetical protein